MNTADMKATMRAALGACGTDNERMLVMAAAIRAQAKCLQKSRKAEADRCFALMDAVERYTRGELSADDCRRVVEGQPADQFDLVDISQCITWHVDKFAAREGQGSSVITAREHKRLSSVIPSLLHGCGVGDSLTSRQAVNRAVLDALVTMLNSRAATEMRGAA